MSDFLPDLGPQAGFDDLPSHRPKRKLAAGEPPMNPVPAPEQFAGPDKGPAGVHYRRLPDGHLATAPTMSIPLVVFLCLVMGLFGYLTVGHWNDGGVPLSFQVTMLCILGFCGTMALYFSLGRLRVRLSGNELSITKTLLGVGIGKRFKVNTIERLRVFSRGGTRWVGPVPGRVSEVVLQVETHDEIRNFGQHCKSEHLRYLRYLIGLHAREQKAKQRPS